MEHIISKLQEMVKKIPSIKVLYKYDSESNDHLIEVLPKSEYLSNVEIEEVESQIVLDFIEKFPYESIIFLTDQDGISMENHNDVFVGSEFEETFTNNDIIINFHNSMFVLGQDDQDVFDVDAFFQFEIDEMKGLFKSYFKKQENSFYPNNELLNKINIVSPENIDCYCCNDEDPSYSHICGENNFALAA